MCVSVLARKEVLAAEVCMWYLCLFVCLCVCVCLFVLATENFGLSVLIGTDPQEGTAFDVRLPKLSDRNRITGV